MRRSQWMIVLVLPGLLWPSLAAAQTAGGITGVARDTSGAVLPGVTVEAASPALIEKVRVTVTDGQGQFTITDLRPGTYSVTFTLTGFATYKRDGIALSAGFTATANAEMKVGGIEETILVSGASPVVDIRNVRTQNVVKAEVLDVLPSGGKSLPALAALTLGASPNRNDVGGDQGELSARIALHGGRYNDGRQYLEGFYANLLSGNGGNRIYVHNILAVQEAVLDTGTGSAEAETGGANVNLVPRDGGNRFSLYGTANYTDHHFSAKGVPDALVARGISPQSSLKVVYDYGVGLGGPVKRDTLWFYAANRWWGSQLYGANNYFNKSTNPYVYVADLTRPAYGDSFYRDNGVRFTWQATPKHKFTQAYTSQLGCQCYRNVFDGSNVAPESSLDSINLTNLSLTTWTYPVTNKLLIQAGVGFVVQKNETATAGYALTKNVFTSGGTVAIPHTFSITELTTGYRWNEYVRSSTSFSPYNSNPFSQRASVSYVTGSHAAKIGLQTFQGEQVTDPDLVGPHNKDNKQLDYQFRNGVPASLTQWAGPFLQNIQIRSVALFAQDQWTLSRLTLNLGARFDHFWGYTPAGEVPAYNGPFISTRSVPELRDIPNFKDVTPRLGAAYDVFGNGKTAIKGAFGRYLAGQGVDLGSQFGPALAIVQSVTRTWNDASTFPAGDPRNGNFIPDCVLTDLRANGECGQVNNLAFGQPITNITFADDARTGWGVRPYNYQTSVQLQHQLGSGVGLAVGYFRTWWRNQTVTQNTAVTPADFTPYCITAPTDPRLSTSGRQICGFYDVNPNKFGQVSNVVRRAKDFGVPEQIYNGVEISIDARWGKGALLQGGVSVGRQTIDNCYANGHPELTPESFAPNAPRVDGFCSTQSPWWDGSGSQMKFMAVYPLRWDINVSGTFKNQPGIPQTANLVLGNAQIVPSLGRNLAACPATGTCTASATVGLIPIGTAPGINDSGSAATQFDMRLTEVDFRVSKGIRFGRTRLRGNFDIYNLFNKRTPQTIVPTYGTSWLRPTLLLGGRLLKFGAQVDW